MEGAGQGGREGRGALRGRPRGRSEGQKVNWQCDLQSCNEGGAGGSTGSWGQKREENGLRVRAVEIKEDPPHEESRGCLLRAGCGEAFWQRLGVGELPGGGKGRLRWPRRRLWAWGLEAGNLCD